MRKVIPLLTSTPKGVAYGDAHLQDQLERAREFAYRTEKSRQSIRPAAKASSQVLGVMNSHAFCSKGGR